MNSTLSVIHSDPDILGGIPVFLGTRVPLQNLIDYLSAGDKLEEFLHSFPSVSREQAVAALAQAGEALEHALHRRREPRRPGSARGSVLFMAENFDATPEDFEDYL